MQSLLMSATKNLEFWHPWTKLWLWKFQYGM